MIARSVTVALCCGLLGGARASVDQTAPRDGGGSPQVKGTGVIAGVLLNSDATPAPIRRALVTLSSASLATSQLTSTDDAGRFAFSGLPAGRFLFGVSKTGFVRDNYGSRQPGDAGAPIALTSGQRVTVTMKMTRAAVITGTVLLPTGAPTSAARVVLMKAAIVNGERRLVAAVGGAYGVDDRGVYRFSGLAAGEYFVTVSAWNSGADEMRLADLSATPPSTPARVGYSPVFYPGVVDPARATAVKVTAGEERSGIDIPIQFVPTARIDGVILDPAGQPLPRVDASMVDTLQLPRPAIQVRAGPDGRFSLLGITPGRYVLRVRAAPTGAVPVPVPGPVGRGAAAPPLSLWASHELEVDGRDLADIVVRLQPGRTISGRIVFEPGAAPAPAGPGLFGVFIEDPQGRPGQPAASAFVDEAGGFVMSGIPPGRYRFSVQVFPETRSLPGWTLKSAVVDGRDVLDELLTIGADRDVTGLTVSYSDRAAELSGVLQDANGQPAAEYFVVAFSTDRKFWSDGSRRVARVRPAADGGFAIAGLPPGEYYVCALTNVEPGQLTDPSFLERLIGSSFKITLAEGQKKRQDLRIGGGW